MISKIQTLYTYSVERSLVWALLTSLVGAMFLYVVLVGLTAFNLAAHDSTQRDIRIFKSSMSDLESSYLARSGHLNQEHALLLGFQEPQKELFAFRKRLVQNDVNTF